MPLSLAQDAIALLIDLAERGDIDPWDVKVVDVIDRFLIELNPFTDAGGEPYEANLSQSGQAFLYASMLLLLKAESLTQTEMPEEANVAEAEAELDLGGLGGAALPPFLERRLRRRAVAQPPRSRRVTLKELINQLQSIAAALEDDSPRSRRLTRPQPQSRKQAIRAIAQLAHQENLSEMAAALEAFFAQHRDTIAATEGWLDFDLLIDLWSQFNTLPPSTSHSPNHERVGIFWALLLLSAQSKVELAQDAFYQDLKIQVIPGPAENVISLSEMASPDS